MSPAPSRSDRDRAQRAWCLYDAANSAFATSILAAILPTYFAAVASRSMPAHLATAWWGYANSAAMLGAAVLGPVLGAIADRRGLRKRILFVCVVSGSLATAALAIVPHGQWQVLLMLFAGGFLAFAVGNVFYDSLLGTVASDGELHRVSARGFAYGYIGGGILLALNLAWIMMPARFGFRDADAASRASFVSVAVWWVLLSLPLLRRVPEPAVAAQGDAPRGHWYEAFGQVANTLAGLRRQPELLRFLIAFWLYSDGIGTIVKMATVYGAEVGIGRNDLIGALLLVQVLAAPASILFGRFAAPLGPQRSIAIGLAGYVGITALGFFMRSPIHFWMIAVLVALFQGGTQALSRSIFASLVPPARAGEMFGFYSISEKFAGIVGPLMFGLVAQATGTGRWAVLTLLPFFAVGGWLLLTVDLERGRARVAHTRVPDAHA